MTASNKSDRELLAQIQSLPSEQRAKLERFIELLQRMNDDETQGFATAVLSEAAFNRVWDNPDDAVYDSL